MSVRPRVLVLADLPGWAWARKAAAYARHLSDEFAVTVAYQTATPLPRFHEYDVIHCFEVSQVHVVPADVPGRVVAGLTALVSKTWGDERMARWAGRCAALHGNSPAIVEVLRAYHDRIYYCPNGVDAAFFRRLRPRDQNGELLACHVGKPNPRKGGALIVEACRRAGIRCLLVQRTAHIALPIEAVRDRYQEAWVYLTASTMDGTPNGALEAAACEVAQLGNAVGNLPELIVSGRNGFLLDDPVLTTEDPIRPRLSDVNLEWYVDRLRWCKTHPAETLQMGEQARRDIVARWTWERQVEHVRMLWREVLG